MFIFCVQNYIWMYTQYILFQQDGGKKKWRNNQSVKRSQKMPSPTSKQWKKTKIKCNELQHQKIYQVLVPWRQKKKTFKVSIDWTQTKKMRQNLDPDDIVRTPCVCLQMVKSSMCPWGWFALTNTASETSKTDGCEYWLHLLWQKRSSQRCQVSV